MEQSGSGLVMGTPLSQLENAPPGASDTDLVSSIFQDMQKPPSMANPVISQSTGLHMGSPMPPSIGARNPMIMSNQNMAMPHTPDPSVATAHMIGSAHPTQNDFQHMMMASNSYGGSAGMPIHMGYGQPMGNGPQIPVDAPKKNWNAIWVDELRQPFIVMILVFVITLPWFHLLISHYTPQFLKPTGEFTTVGLLFRAGLGGLLFWFLQRIIAPLIIL